MKDAYFLTSYIDSLTVCESLYNDDFESQHASQDPEDTKERKSKIGSRSLIKGCYRLAQVIQ